MKEFNNYEFRLLINGKINVYINQCEINSVEFHTKSYIPAIFKNMMYKIDPLYPYRILVMHHSVETMLDKYIDKDGVFHTEIS